MVAPIDLSGRRFGRLLVVEVVKTERRRKWRCVCDCGGSAVCESYNLQNGHTKSCGCWVSDVLKNRNQTGRPSKKYQDPTTSARNSTIYNYRKSAKKRGVEWCLSTDECVALFLSDCYYCGAAPANECQMYGGTRKALPIFVYNGIDRLDNSRAYEKGNVVAACFICNRAKNTMGESEFLSWVERVYKHMKLG